MTVKSRSFIRLTQDEVEKLNTCIHSISTKPNGVTGKPSKHQVITGLIDGAYAVALKSLYESDLISDAEMRLGIDQLPDYFHDRLWKTLR